MKNHGLFITIEGIEGVGKSTILQFLKQYLEQKKISYVATREPGGTAIGEAIRQVLLTPQVETMCSDTELLLLFAARAQNIFQVIRPALQRGDWVISDRFTDATFAYQGGGRGIAEERIAGLNKWLVGDFIPDLTILLDAPVEVGMQRLLQRGAKDRIEQEGVEFFQRIREYYLQLAAKFPERYRIVQADKPLPIVEQQIMKILDVLVCKESV